MRHALYTALAFLFIAAASLVGRPAAAQTPSAKIENASGDSVLTSYADGALVAFGSVGTGTIPATGSGTRMMWYPTKAAFRVGEVTGSKWDASSVGNYSVAFGRDTKASGVTSTALGTFTVASGDLSTAMGSNTIASAFAATATGKETVAATESSLTVGKYNDRNRGNDDNDPTTGPLFVVGNGDGSSLPSSRSDALVLDQSGNLSIQGVFEGGSAGNTYAGHFQGGKSQDESNPSAHVALIENTGGSGVNGADGLAIQLGPTDPDNTHSFLTFFNSSGAAQGAIEGAGGGGINLNTSSADFAEELPVAAGTETPEAADVVGVQGGEVHLDTNGADRLMVVSTAPAVTGNATPSTEADDGRRVPVAFVGQVPVRVRGEAEVGDLIVASGRDDGTARAVAPGDYRRVEHGPIAGRAWSAKPSEEIGKVTAAVGLDQSGVLARRVEEQQAQIEKQKAEIEELEAENEAIKKRLAALEAHRPSAAGLVGPWGLVTVLAFGFGGLLGSLLWRRL